MLSKANIDDNMITKLGDGMKHLGEQAPRWVKLPMLPLRPKDTAILW